MPTPKKLLSLRLDSDIVDWFKEPRPGLSDPDQRGLARLRRAGGEAASVSGEVLFGEVPGSKRHEATAWNRARGQISCSSEATRKVEAEAGREAAHGSRTESQ